MTAPDGAALPEWLVPAVGAALFASDEPVAASELARAFGGLDVADVEAAVRALDDGLARGASGLRVEAVAGGFRLATRPEVGAWVRQYMRQRNRTRLSPAAIETLAIVAYRQPVTMPEIQAIRGRDPAAAIRTLLDKKLVRPLGRKKVVGHPLLYGTSRRFLIHFGLNRLGDLPSMEEFGELAGLGADEAVEIARSTAAAPAGVLEDELLPLEAGDAGDGFDHTPDEDPDPAPDDVGASDEEPRWPSDST
jgi:segregation and condensation protein B